MQPENLWTSSRPQDREITRLSEVILFLCWKRKLIQQKLKPEGATALEPRDTESLFLLTPRLRDFCDSVLNDAHREIIKNFYKPKFSLRNCCLNVNSVTKCSNKWVHNIAQSHFIAISTIAVALLVGHRTCDLQVAGSTPGWAPLLLTPVCLCHQAV